MPETMDPAETLYASARRASLMTIAEAARSAALDLRTSLGNLPLPEPPWTLNQGVTVKDNAAFLRAIHDDITSGERHRADRAMQRLMRAVSADA